MPNQFYYICTGTDFEQLATRASAMIGSGWRPTGAPFISGTNACQALWYDPNNALIAALGDNASRLMEVITNPPPTEGDEWKPKQ